MRRISIIRSVVLIVGALAVQALAGGGGQNMLLVVNPNDENALRVATAYQRMRAIPDRNIVFIASPVGTGQSASAGSLFNLTAQQFKDVYATRIANEIAARGLAGQIDYIGQIGGPHGINTDLSFPRQLSVNFGLTMLSVVNKGLDLKKLASDYAATAPSTAMFNSDSAASNFGNQSKYAAIHHSQTHNVGYSSQGTISSQYYMAGTIGYTGFLGLAAEDVIANLQRTANADGTKPGGTIYFEKTVNAQGNPTANSSQRVGQWAAVQDAVDDLRAAGKTNLHWVEETNGPGDNPMPVNKPDIAGAVVGGGRIDLGLPNGSTYQAGSWVDNMTSYGARYTDRAHAKATEFLRAGASATSGTVNEPTNVWTRWPHATIHLKNAAGLTLGESFYKAVRGPDMQMFFGDLLGQAYADVPEVTITSNVNGDTINIIASATLPANKVLATGLRQYELYVDGVLAQVRTPGGSGNGSFSLDKKSLSDGHHEIRVVAVNNAAIESQGYATDVLVVNNHGRSISAPANVTLDPKGVQTLSNINISLGDQASPAVQTELRFLGRTVGSASGAASSVSIDPAMLAYGSNPVVPVVKFADGTEVAGEPITVTREKPWQAGTTPTDPRHRQYGVKAEYFMGKGASNGEVTGSDYSGEADIVAMHPRLCLWSGHMVPDPNPWPNTALQNSNPEAMATTSIDKLAIRFSGSFEVPPGDEGEYSFFFENSNDGLRLLIDGQEVLSYWNRWRQTTMEGGAAWLLPGEHTLTLLTNNALESESVAYYDVSLTMRGPDGINQFVDDSFIYQTVPEPSAALIWLGGVLVLIRRRADRRYTSRGSVIGCTQDGGARFPLAEGQKASGL